MTWLAQRTDKTTVATLMRCSWEAVAAIVTPVVAEHVDRTRLDHLYRTGVDEVSYRKSHRYLTAVADHEGDGAVVWAAEGKNAATLGAFYDQLGPERIDRLQAVSLDMGSAYAKATRTKAPDATRCIDPFHVIKLANDAIDTTGRWAWSQARNGRPQASPRQRRRHPLKADAPFRKIKHTRWALLKDPNHLRDSQQAVLDELRRCRHVLWRAYETKEPLRDLYRLPDPTQAAKRLDAWLARTCRSRIPAMVKVSQTLR